MGLPTCRVPYVGMSTAKLNLVRGLRDASGKAFRQQNWRQVGGNSGMSYVPLEPCTKARLRRVGSRSAHINATATESGKKGGKLLCGD